MRLEVGGKKIWNVAFASNLERSGPQTSNILGPKAKRPSNLMHHGPCAQGLAAGFLSSVGSIDPLRQIKQIKLIKPVQQK